MLNSMRSPNAPSIRTFRGDDVDILGAGILPSTGRENRKVRNSKEDTVEKLCFL